MLFAYELTCWHLLFAAVLAGNVAFAAPGFPDRGSQDLDASCRDAGPPRGTLRGDREAAVFTVSVTRDGRLQPNGTAILIDNTGIFLTAAHVVHFYENQQISVSQKVNGPIGEISRTYEVRVISDTTDWQKEDLVLLQAQGWDNPSIYPIPFRFDDLDYVDGFFIGHAEDMEAPVFQHFTDAFRDAETASGMRYSGSVFPHASGALLLDQVGRAFAMILRHADFSNDQLANLTIEKLFRILWERDLFSAFPLSDGLDKLKRLPPSPQAADLISRLRSKRVDNAFLIRLQHDPLTPPDMIHLIDAIFVPDTWKKICNDMTALPILMKEVQSLSATLCTNNYYFERLSALLRNVNGCESKRALGGVASPGQQTSVQDALLEQFDIEPVHAAQTLGVRFIERALADSSRPDIAQAHTRLALSILHRAADDPALRRALEDGRQNRDYAAVMGNLALAEDIGAAYGIGSREAATDAIFAATALGGSPTAYELAARYALRQSDVIAAAGLYVRADAMLSEAKRADQTSRAKVAHDFDALVGRTSVPSGATIGNFRIATLPLAERGPVSTWYALAMNEVGKFTFRGSTVSPGRELDRDVLVGLVFDPTGWAIQSGDYANTRYSQLDEINASNVGNLQVAWTFSTGILRGHEGGPLVIGDVMYVHTPFPNNIYALDLNTDGKILWKYEPKQDPDVIPVMCCDTVSRGVAYGDGKIVLAQADTTLVALDAKTGKPVWSVRNGDPKKGETMTGAPVVYKDKVFVGISGGAFGVRGSVTAYDLKTGHREWRGYSMGLDAETLIDPRNTLYLGKSVGKNSGVNTWDGDQWKIGGGTTSGWISYDPQLNLLYYGSGGPAPWNSMQRPNDNRWSASIWARDLDTGIAKWVYQMTPHSEWAWNNDGSNEMVLVDQKIQGTMRKTLVHFDGNGFAYTLDRENGALLVAEKYDPKVNWATHIDLQTGRPVVAKQYSPEASGEDRNTRGVCPASLGTKGEEPSSYSPQTGLFYVPTNHLCMDYEPFKVSYTAGQPYVGATLSMWPPAGDNNLGNFLAWDARTGQIAWANPEPFSVWSGALATAGGVVFYGTLEGYLKAVDAKTGKELYKFKTPSGIVGNVMTYKHRGKQFVAILSGVGGWAGIGVAAGLTNEADGLGAVGAYKALANYTTLGGLLTVFSLPAE